MSEAAPRYIPVGPPRRPRQRPAPPVSPAAPLVRRVPGRQIRAATAAKLSFAGIAFIGAWLLLLTPDLLYSPKGAGLLRLGAPAVLCLLFAQDVILRRNLPRSSLSPWLAVLAVVGLLSSSLSDVPVLGYLKLALYMSIVLPICLTPSIRNVFASLSSGLRMLAYLALLMLCACALLLPVNGTGIFDNPNKSGMLAVCLWPAMAALLRSPLRRDVLVARVGLGVALLVCALTWSRGALLGTTAGMVTLWALRQSPTFRSVVTTFFLLAIVTTFVYFFTQEAFEKYAYKNRETFVDGTRTFMLQETINQWSNRPIFGFGFGLSWTLDAGDVDMVLSTGRMSWFTVEFGNSILAILSGGGLALLAVFVGMFTAVAVHAFKAARLPNVDPAARHMLIVYMSGVAGMLVHAQAEAWLMAPLNWSTAIFYLYLALTALLSNRLITQARSAHLNTPRTPANPPR